MTFLIYVALRVALLSLGAWFAVPSYADALPYRDASPPSRRAQARTSILAALLWTVVAAVGVVGWRP